MGLETVLVIWGIAQLLVLAGIGLYAHTQALAARDAAGELRALQHDHDATLIELKASRAANEVLRKAARNAGADMGSILDAVRVERERLLQPSGDEDRGPEPPEAAVSGFFTEDSGGGIPDMGPGDRPSSGL